MENAAIELNRAGIAPELREHDCVAWQMFGCLVKDTSEFYRWPDKTWLPLAFSLSARRVIRSNLEMRSVFALNYWDIA